jgi:sterol desaturase/sphingolipid hydroxylase (fatty acid hydroxylase superfamily)
VAATIAALGPTHQRDNYPSDVGPLIVFVPPLLAAASVLPRRWGRWVAMSAVLAAGLSISAGATVRAAVPLLMVWLVVDLLPGGWAKETRRTVHVAVIWACLGVVALYPMAEVRQWAARVDVPRLSSLFDVDNFGVGMLLIGFLAAVCGDFIVYWVHRTKHRVSWLWRFHEIHHSTPEMGMFAQRRLHPVDTLIGQVWQLVPLLFIGSKYFNLFLPYALLRTAAGYWHHSNTRFESEAAAKLFVTPSIHRVHHSARTEDFDANFGSLLSIWDRMFGTFREPSTESLAQTGVEGSALPIESDPSLTTWEVVWGQFWAPFRLKSR